MPEFVPELCDYIELDEAILQIVENDEKDYDRIKKVLLNKQDLLTPPQYTLLSDFAEFIHFISCLYSYQHSKVYEYAHKATVRAAIHPGEEVGCEWPGCHLPGTDKDHIFPKSILKSAQITTYIGAQKRGGSEKTGWDKFNSAWLCSRHNKNVKNDSIGIGIWLMTALER
jgi:hypothetical protein